MIRGENPLFSETSIYQPSNDAKSLDRDGGDLLHNLKCSEHRWEFKQAMRVEVLYMNILNMSGEKTDFKAILGKQHASPFFQSMKKKVILGRFPVLD